MLQAPTSGAHSSTMLAMPEDRGSSDMSREGGDLVSTMNKMTIQTQDEPARKPFGLRQEALNPRSEMGMGWKRSFLLGGRPSHGNNKTSEAEDSEVNPEPIEEHTKEHTTTKEAPLKAQTRRKSGQCPAPVAAGESIDPISPNTIQRCIAQGIKNSKGKKRGGWFRRRPKHACTSPVAMRQGSRVKFPVATSTRYTPVKSRIASPTVRDKCITSPTHARYRSRGMVSPKSPKGVYPSKSNRSGNAVDSKLEHEVQQALTGRSGRPPKGKSSGWRTRPSKPGPRKALSPIKHINHPPRPPVDLLRRHQASSSMLSPRQRRQWDGDESDVKTSVDPRAVRATASVRRSTLLDLRRKPAHGTKGEVEDAIRSIPLYEKQLAKYEVNRDDIKAIQVIGAGQFGKVYLSKQRMADNTCLRRAVKVVVGRQTEVKDALFLRECAILARLRHQNITKLEGISQSKRPWLAVLEFVQHGDLRKNLSLYERKGFQVTLTEQIYMSAQIVEGMRFLHQNRVVHRDLAARNVLLGKNSTVKIADFGHAREYTSGVHGYVMRDTQRLSIKWTALEIFSHPGKIFKESTDVWSFGVTMWEIFSNAAKPYPDIKAEKVPRAVRLGTRLEQPELCPAELYSIMASCWEADATLRPTFSDLLDSLNAVVHSIQPIVPVRDVGAAFLAHCSNLGSFGRSHSRRLHGKSSMRRPGGHASANHGRERRNPNTSPLCNGKLERTDTQPPPKHGAHAGGQGLTVRTLLDAEPALAKPVDDVKKTMRGPEAMAQQRHAARAAASRPRPLDNASTPRTGRGGGLEAAKTPQEGRIAVTADGSPALFWAVPPLPPKDTR
eukprot:m.82189 g.82189  ORF g.82189 m.82189 type:complete len:835 (-) comp16321_c0_seq3:3762-6266(-)